LVHSLFQMLYPYYLRPVPSKTLVSLTPKQGMLDKSKQIPKGTALSCHRKNAKAAQVTYTTCWDTWIAPIEVVKFYTDQDQQANHSLSLALRICQNGNRDQIQWDNVDFLIAGDVEERSHLFFMMAERLDGVRLKGDKKNHKLQLEWVGFHSDHDYNDEDNGRFAHIHYLRDYFDYPERFFYFRIKGLSEALASQPDSDELQLDFIFKQSNHNYQPENNHILLHTVVAQNLFTLDLEGFKVNDESYEYLVTPQSDRSDLEVNSLIEIKASQDHKEEELRPYYRFQHGNIAEKRQWFYAIRQEGSASKKQSMSGSHDAFDGWRTYIRFIDANHLGPGALKGWQVGGTARCTNGNGGKITVGQLNQFGKSRGGGGLRDMFTPENIRPSSRPIWPKLTGNAEWLFLAHLALDYSEFHNPETMETLLKLYILDDRDSEKRKVESITPHKPISDYIVRRGSSIPGECLRLDVDLAGFKNHVGEVALFTRVLGHFLKAYASLNSFLKLEVHISPDTQFQFLAWGDD